jgi:hypothetical protein
MVRFYLKWLKINIQIQNITNISHPTLQSWRARSARANPFGLEDRQTK